MNRSLVPLLVCAGCLLLLPTPAARAGEALPGTTVEPTPVQVELHEDGFDAAVSGDHRDAADFFMASLALGELNVTWLNLGRELAHLGRCEDAALAYDRALFAPAVVSPSRIEVASAIERFREELDRDCREAGSHAPDPAWASLMEGIAAAPDGDGDAGRNELLLWSGVGAASLGGVLLVSAIVVDAGMIGARVDEVDAAMRRGDEARVRELDGEIDDLQTSATALYVAGGLGLATAAGLLTWYWLDGPPSEAPTLAEGGRVDLWTPAAVTTSAGLSWTATF